ncbi:phage tail tube protein [Zobellella sp. DQSA1]|uniref:phage tail tube protein n=1 Tax=Zobellella sp. DQSA1 TaxID=3342386 RepID=UPI0035BEBD16
MLTRKKALLIAAELSYGVPADIADATLIQLAELENAPYEGERQQRTRLRQTFGANADVNVGPYATVTATVPLAGSGVVGTPPNYGLLLRACGAAETVAAGVSVTYSPVTDDHESFTVWYVEDGQLQQLPGVRGTLELSAPVGQFPTYKFTLTGLYKRPVVHNTQLAHEISNIVPELPVNKQNTPVFSVHGHQAVGESLTMTMGNTVTYRNQIGHEEVSITDRVSTCAVQIEAPDLGTKNYFQALESHQQEVAAPITLQHGTEPGNTVEFSAPKAQLSSLSRADKNGLVHYNMNVQLLPTVGDDEWTITIK